MLNDWATDPDDSHVAVTPDDAKLEDLFADLAANISKPGATNIVIDEVVNADFSIISVIPPSKGTAMMLNSSSLQWKISELGVSGNEGASLEFCVKHVGHSGGTKLVNQSVTYSDAEGNAVTFPEPSVQVNCGIVINPEKCPEPVEFTIDGCQDSFEVDLGSTYLESQGRIVQMNVIIKNVCPNRRVALAVNLTEADSQGNEYQRGLKTITIPAHHYPGCRDVQVKGIKFILPEDLNVSRDASGQMCADRNLKVHVFAHNIDTDFQCCDMTAVAI